MTKLYDPGDSEASGFQEWAAQYDAEAMTILSSFTMDSSGGDGSLNPNLRIGNGFWLGRMAEIERMLTMAVKVAMFLMGSWMMSKETAFL